MIFFIEMCRNFITVELFGGWQGGYLPCLILLSWTGCFRSDVGENIIYIILLNYQYVCARASVYNIHSVSQDKV